MDQTDLSSPQCVSINPWSLVLADPPGSACCSPQHVRHTCPAQLTGCPVAVCRVVTSRSTWLLESIQVGKGMSFIGPASVGEREELSSSPEMLHYQHSPADCLAPGDHPRNCSELSAGMLHKRAPICKAVLVTQACCHNGAKVPAQQPRALLETV